MSEYLRESISNGNKIEQALIRRWWYENHGAHGTIVWEYYLQCGFVDAMWFPNSLQVGQEVPGKKTAKNYPLHGNEIVLLEAKAGRLSHGLIGQALVYNIFAKRAGAVIREVSIFAQFGDEQMVSAAKELGLSVVINPL